jgi:hypothetical protein
MVDVVLLDFVTYADALVTLDASLPVELKDGVSVKQLILTLGAFEFFGSRAIADR